MAHSKTVATWPGSSSFNPGDTPFGYYESDASFLNDVDKVSEEFITNLQNQSQHHQTMSVKAQGALEVVPQMVEAFLKLLNDGEESKKK